MAQFSSSAMPSSNIPKGSVWGVQTAFVSYSGVFSASVSDIVEMVRLPRAAIVDMIRVGGFLAATGAGISVGDDVANTAAAHTRYGTVSLSNTSSTTVLAGGQYNYSLSDDDRDVTILLQGKDAATSASGSASIWMQVFYHMP